MARLTVQDTMAQLDWLTDRISTQVRWFAAAVVALIWGLLLAPPATFRLWPAALLSVGLLAVSVLFVDFLQYAVGFIAVRRQHQRLLDAPSAAAEGYDARDPWYRARADFFWAKQGLAVATFLGLLFALIPPLAR